MGCCLERESEPRIDLPLKGAKHAFKIKAEGMMSSNFTVYDNTPNEENSGAPWLRLVHSGNLDNNEGTISVEKKAKGADDKPLLKAEVGPIEFKELDSSTKTEAGSWIDWGKDETTQLAWEARRVVKVMADADGKMPAAVVSIKYLGVACCRKDVNYEMDGDREVHWEKWARTKEVNVTLELEGASATLVHNLGADSGSNGSYDQKYKVEGNFNFEYISKWGTDEVFVHTEDGAEPLAACTVGFIIAYWLHPKRVEDNAMEKAYKILQDKQGWFP